jgi:hypothetical protein
MIAKVLVPEAEDFVELVLLYHCAEICKNHCLSFRKHTTAPNCLSRLSMALVNCKFYKIVSFFTSWMAFVRLFKFNILASMLETKEGNTSD